MLLGRSSQLRPRSPKPDKICEDVDNEFCKRAISLLASFYETPSVTEMTTFPPVKEVELPKKSKKLSFDSSVIDIRLRRQMELNAIEAEERENDISRRVQELRELVQSESVDLSNVFAPERAERPQTPLYIVKENEDSEEMRKNRRRKPKEMDIAAINHQFTIRLQQAKEKGESRARNRVMRVSQISPTPASSTPTRRSRTTKEHEQASLIRTKQVNYMTPRQYAEKIRSKSPSYYED